MAVILVTDMITRARSAADMTDDFVTIPEWVAFLNAEKRILDRQLAFAGHLFNEQESQINPTGLAYYGLTDVRAVIAVYHVENGKYRRLSHADQFDGNIRDPATSNGDRATRFRCSLDSTGEVRVHLYPNPSSGDYRVVYLPESPDVTINDSVTYVLGYEERIVLGMARRALAKEETVNPAIEARIGEIENEIERSAWDRAMAGARVRNVDKVERGWFDYPQIPSREFWYFT